MKKYIASLFIAFSFGALTPLSVSAQQDKIDSLKKKLISAKNDTNKIDILNLLGQQLINIGNYDTALQIGQEALNLSNSLHFKKGSFNAYKNIGIIYEYKGDLPNSVSQHLNALHIAEELGNKKYIANCYNNIGLVYEKQGNYTQALEQYLKSLKIRNEIGDKRGIAMSHNNIGIVYFRKGNFSLALEEYHKSLKFREEIGDKYGIASNLNNIGGIYYYQGKYALALEQYLKSLKIKEELGLTQGVASSNNNIGSLYIKLKKFSRAQEHLTKGLSLALSIGSKNDIKESYGSLSLLDSAKGDYKKCLHYYKLAIIYRDSLLNEENTKKTVQAEMNFEFDKKEAAAKLEQEKKEAIANAESKKQKMILILISCGLLLVTTFAVFAYRSYLQKQKANIEITKQKHIIEEKQKEILDSIYYARRIQRALLPAEKYIARMLSRSRATPHD